MIGLADLSGSDVTHADEPGYWFVGDAEREGPSPISAGRGAAISGPATRLTKRPESWADCLVPLRAEGQVDDGEVLVATLDDGPEIFSALQGQHIRDFVTPMATAEIEEVIESPDGALLVSREASGKLCAVAHLHGLRNPHRSIELRRLGIVAPGHGHGTRVIPGIVRHVFGRCGAQRFWLDVFPENEPARRLYRRAGFVEEGTLRNTYIWKGAPQSTMVMSILREEYEIGVS